jgi:beta-xylosidase
MQWEDGWPVVGVNGKVPESLDLPAGKSTLSGIVTSDEFNRKDGDSSLPLAWQWNHNPSDRDWSLTTRPGFLRLTTGRVDDSVLQARNTLTQRTFGPECSATTCLDTAGMKDGDCAGLMALQNRYAFIGVTMDGGVKQVVMTSSEKGSPVQVASMPLNQSRVFLRMDCDFRERADLATFSYSLDGRKWNPLGKAHSLHYDLVHFMGCRFGLFNFATKAPGGFVDFDFFRLGSPRPKPIQR